MTIQTIINNTIKQLKKEGKTLTPDAYSLVFCKEAKKAGMMVEDCQQLEKFKQSLSKDFSKDLQNYSIRTVNELVRFLIAKLNRTKPTQATQIIDTQVILAQKVCNAIALLHNKEASLLAKSTSDLLSNSASLEQLETLKQQWINFSENYDETFLLKLKEFGSIDTNDLSKSIKSFASLAKDKDQANIDSQKYSRLLVSSLVPSIASNVDASIAKLSQKIQRSPELLEEESMRKEIRSAISLRIALDKKSVKEMIGSIDDVLDKLSFRLIDLIEYSDKSTKEIQHIKKDLESYTQDSPENFNTAHKKLFTIATALEENTKLLSKDLQDHSKEVNALSTKINKLEEELNEAKKESREDFLTKIANRRSLDEFVEQSEAEFQRFKRNYSLVMFDIDLFKKVNDTYGHDAGDAILTAVAKIIKKESRTVDKVGRYGGEEFLAVLSETDADGAMIFANKVRERVEKSRFMYRGERIEVTISAGIAQRVVTNSAQATQDKADENLYKAKENGRNRAEK